MGTAHLDLGAIRLTKSFSVVILKSKHFFDLYHITNTVVETCTYIILLFLENTISNLCLHVPFLINLYFLLEHSFTVVVSFFSVTINCTPIPYKALC